MQAREWIRFAGGGEFSFYPLIRKIDILSSNSYLIGSEDDLILIDPGAIPGQADTILSVISDLPGSRQLTSILLTHTHMDHCHSLVSHPVLSSFADLAYSHVSGFEALKTEDYGVTQAKILGKRLSPTLIGNPLFTGNQEAGRYGLFEETIPCSGNLEITAYHTPGHSPESICYRIGTSLFIGDTLFAGSPGIAGIIGYSRNDLLHSLNGLKQMIAGENITVCYSGHGNPIPAVDAIRSIDLVSKQVEELNGIETQTPERMKETALFAEDLMAEIDETLTIISGRITFVSHMLEELEEGDSAGKISSVIDSAAVDDLLARYNSFAEEYRRGAHQHILLALNAANIAGKLERLIDRGGLGAVIEPWLLDHLDELINDYMTLFRGFRPIATLKDCNTTEICRTVSDSLDPRSTDQVLETISMEDFTAALALRMGRVRVVNEDSIIVCAGAEPIAAIMDPVRFERAAHTLITRCAAYGADKMALMISKTDEETVTITISTGEEIFEDGQMRYLRRAFALSGGTVRRIDDGITVAYPAGRTII
ncbi:MBL fold metallo-hydrolase [Methanocalculus taiwanensis]|uniref:MBL fold metallo-hydrolase n=1 Tax=Methanocalculus taiwanensis TaxID=106207 RepID=A0ABD4TJY3_9EURY|nr:MBL fold metallo-hydrolase [Methanocalculus taiwanensis]MCQ1538064.1 MBL fold metallo-hydrolase [Methanocalculus taiwanensis]